LPESFEPLATLKVACQVKVKWGSHVFGYTLSVVFLESIGTGYLDMWLTNKVPEDTLRPLREFFGGNYRFLNHLLRVGSTSDLQTMCKNIIAQLDTDTFEPSRKSYQEFKDKLQQQQKK
jgi:hypothetical protein